MVNWRESMQQTFEYYKVDPGTWKDVERIENVKSCSINRDSTAETLGSATIDITESLGECYVRIYLITIQNGIRERHPLGTFLVQTPSTSFDGKIQNVSMDAYTPLIELKESPPPLGYSILKTENNSSVNIMDRAFKIAREHARAPIIKPNCDKTLSYNFVANTSDTWFTFLNDLINNANYIFDLDEMGNIMFAPIQDTASLQPVWEYDDGNSSILYPEITFDNDLYGIPNVVEVVYSNGTDIYFSRVSNDDVNSPISTVNRGREIIHRDSNPSFSGIPSQLQVDLYAEKLLKSLSTLEYTISYKHAYCGVRLGDCVRLNYARAGLKNIKAKVVSQSISCEPGCPVSEKAVFTNKLWR